MKNWLKSIFGGANKGLEFAADVLHLPVATEIEAAKDAIKTAASTGDKEAIHKAVDALDDLKPVIKDAIQAGVDTQSKDGPLASKKLFGAMAGIVAALAALLSVKFGIPESLVRDALSSVTEIVMLLLGAQGIIDTFRAKAKPAEPTA
jgi:hypothetical protein